jgi:hypothetical protein
MLPVFPMTVRGDFSPALAVSVMTLSCASWRRLIFSRVDFYASGTPISGDHMLRSESLFGKRETSSTNSRSAVRATFLLHQAAM